MNLRSSVTQAVFAARDGREFDPRDRDGRAAGTPGIRARREPITFVGSPDSIVKQLKVLHNQSGTGVVDLGFQESGIDHQEVMKEIQLFGREVLPRIREF